MEAIASIGLLTATLLALDTARTLLKLHHHVQAAPSNILRLRETLDAINSDLKLVREQCLLQRALGQHHEELWKKDRTPVNPREGACGRFVHSLRNRPCIMVWDPPPWMTLVIILSYILAFHYLHRKQRARYKYHSIVLFGAVIVALSVATWYSVNPVDILLIWVVWSLNMGLLFSFIAGSLQQALDHRQRSNDADREADEKHDAFA